MKHHRSFDTTLFSVTFLLAAITALLLNHAQAAPTLEIRGFGDAVGFKSTERRFLTDYDTPDNRVNFTNLTDIGVNLHSILFEDWSVASQFVAENSSTGFNTQLQWGFLSWNPRQEFAVRAGRVVAPVWLYSQQIKVGYSYLWVRPPSEVYNLNPFSSIDGASVLTRFKALNGIFELELVAGDGSNKMVYDVPGNPKTYNVTIKNFLATSLTYNMDDHLVLRVGCVQANTSVQVDSIYVSNYIGATPVAGANSGVTTDLRTGQARFMSLGVKADFGNFVLSSEFARRLVAGSALTSATGYYTTLGYRVGKWLPHFTYAGQVDLEGTLRPHPDAPTETTLKKNESSWTAGLNFAVNESITAKAEFSRAHLGFEDSSKNINFNIYRVALDFVF